MVVPAVVVLAVYLLPLLVPLLILLLQPIHRTVALLLTNTVHVQVHHQRLAVLTQALRVLLVKVEEIVSAGLLVLEDHSLFAFGRGELVEEVWIFEDCLFLSLVEEVVEEEVGGFGLGE